MFEECLICEVNPEGRVEDCRGGGVGVRMLIFPTSKMGYVMWGEAPLILTDIKQMACNGFHSVSN